MDPSTPWKWLAQDSVEDEATQEEKHRVGRSSDSLIFLEGLRMYGGWADWGEIWGFWFGIGALNVGRIGFQWFQGERVALFRQSLLDLDVLDSLAGSHPSSILEGIHESCVGFWLRTLHRWAYAPEGCDFGLAQGP